MRNLALLLLLAITASTIFAFDVTAFAQETETPEDEITDEEISEETEEEVMGDDVMEDEVPEDEMEATMMEDEEDVDSPRQQLLSGTDPHEIQCGSGLQLVFKASNFHPACIKESSHQILLQRGWVSDHDPSHEELTSMMEALPQSEDVEEVEDTEEMEDTDMEDTGGEEIEIEEEINVEEETTAGNDTEITPQSHTIELSESMDVGAN
ncbi:MAG: hypothetical protein ACT4OD_01040 [Candidatus Nitrosotenuis sp.]